MLIFKLFSDDRFTLERVSLSTHWERFLNETEFLFSLVWNIVKIQVTEEILITEIYENIVYSFMVFWEFDRDFAFMLHENYEIFFLWKSTHLARQGSPRETEVVFTFPALERLCVIVPGGGVFCPFCWHKNNTINHGSKRTRVRAARDMNRYVGVSTSLVEWFVEGSWPDGLKGRTKTTGRKLLFKRYWLDVDTLSAEKRLSDNLWQH